LRERLGQRLLILDGHLEAILDIVLLADRVRHRLAIRPERARLSAEKTGDFARRGKVGQVLYLGATLEYHLTLDGGERALVEAPNDGNAPRFAAGDAN